VGVCSNLPFCVRVNFNNFLFALEQSFMSDKTHYRKAFNSPYLSSADIVEPTIVTVGRVTLEGDKSKKTKDIFNTAYFVEKEIRKGETLKPMILNAHNSRVMRELTGSHFIEDWCDTPITIYVDHNVKFGRDTVEGLRISTEPPRTVKPELTPKQTAKWARAVASWKQYGNLDKVLSVMTISDENMRLITGSH
jgi:hypothetical protein